ncbi:hypothetical protein ACJ41P_10735 [Azospirillum argentinense]|uniref:Uncharacterized protein n=1 Tax=Azospirillum argentinense TaxID=2970906 RepID=A0ABW8V8L4_9PROT
MKITEWFDPMSGDHLEAYYHLCKTGSWPVGFIPNHVVMTPSWQAGLMGIMAELWVEHRLGRIRNR